MLTLLKQRLRDYCVRWAFYWRYCRTQQVYGENEDFVQPLITPVTQG